MREAKRRAFRESRGRQPSGRMVVVYYNYHPASKNPPRAVAKLYIWKNFLYAGGTLPQGEHAMAQNATIRPQQIERARKLLQDLPEKEDRKTRPEAAELLEKDFRKRRRKATIPEN